MPKISPQASSNSDSVVAQKPSPQTNTSTQNIPQQNGISSDKPHPSPNDTQKAKQSINDLKSAALAPKSDVEACRKNTTTTSTACSLNPLNLALMSWHLQSQEHLSEELIGVQAQNLYLINYLNKLEYLILHKTKHRKRETKSRSKMLQALLNAVKDYQTTTQTSQAKVLVQDPQALERYLEFDKQEQVVCVDGDGDGDLQFVESMFGVKRIKDADGDADREANDIDKNSCNQEQISDLLQPGCSYLATGKGQGNKNKHKHGDDDESSDSDSDDQDKAKKDKEDDNEPKDTLVKLQQTADLIENEMDIKLPKRQNKIVIPEHRSGYHSSSSSDIDFEKVNDYIENQWTKTAKMISVTIGKQSKHNR